jgi:hypothetical protein
MTIPAISDTNPSSRIDTSALAVLRRLIGGGRMSGLRGLDDFQLRDIGASNDDIWRVHKLRNGERPTLLVG